jgi:hypothetical protein
MSPITLVVRRARVLAAEGIDPANIFERTGLGIHRLNEHKRRSTDPKLDRLAEGCRCSGRAAILSNGRASLGTR